jgi:hypothetical protein
MAKPVNLEDFKPDFSPDECERRMSEVVRRFCGQKPTFSLQTGQPFTGEKLLPEELRRRGYAN